MYDSIPYSTNARHSTHEHVLREPSYNPHICGHLSEMNNFGFDGGAYAFGPAANIERTLYGTTVVRVADDRQSRPQLAMPFHNQLGLSQDPQFKVLVIKTQTIANTSLDCPR